MAIVYDKPSFENGKFVFKKGVARLKSGKLFTIGCHFPSKSTNFETLAPTLGFLVDL